MGNKILQLVFLLVIVSGCSTTDQSTSESVHNASNKLNKNQVTPYPTSRICDTLKLLFAQNNVQQIQLKNFYANNGFNALWTNDSIVKQGLQLIEFSKYHGLNPDEYGFYAMDSLYHRIHFGKDTTTRTYLQLELMLSKGIISYCSHLLHGKLNPLHFHSSWNYAQRNIQNGDSLILDAVKQNRIAELEAIFEPDNSLYINFKKELKKLYASDFEENDGNAITYPGFIIQQGVSNKYVAELKRRLKLADSVNWKFTTELHDSIRSFQRTHGLDPDGKPGIKTYDFLAWNTQRYVDALKVNMERLRWLSNNTFSNGIVVNIPSFSLWLWQNDNLVFKSNVIVGKTKNETPVFQSDINYLVLNPCWTVPNSIAIDKMLPRLQKDSSYLKNRNMFLGINGVEQNTDSIDFSTYTKANFPYKIYQRTGDDNALGQVKFMFENNYSIYLHDTPYKNLFSRDSRAYSHGCIRVQNAMDLADVLLYKMNAHKTQMDYYLKKGYPEKVSLSKTIPISIIYITTWAEKGKVIFYSDVYAKDYRVLADLEIKSY